MKEIRWERVASMLFCLGVGCLAVWLAFRFLLPLLLPFLVAWGVSIAIRPLAKRLSMRLHVSQKLCSVLLLFFFLSETLLLIGASLHRLILELEHLLERLLSEGGELSDAVEHSFDLFETLTSSIGFLRRVEAGERFSEFRDSFNSMVSNMLSAALTSLSSFLPQFAARLLSFLPSFLLVTVVTVVSGFYFCTEGDSITRGVLAVVPNAVTQRLPVWKQRVKLISWRYLRAYLLLLLLTFSELFLGFCVLRVEYAFLLAILIALVDMLPILGVGTVLVPWALIALIQRDFQRGIGLLVLYLLMLILRQVLEPKLLGKSLGLHPLLTLFSTWIGWKLLGFVGMLLAPFAALLCKMLVSQLKKTSDK